VSKSTKGGLIFVAMMSLLDAVGGIINAVILTH
jgi:hypothetical protein